jgi:hypothetical protein
MKAYAIKAYDHSTDTYIEIAADAKLETIYMNWIKNRM